MIVGGQVYFILVLYVDLFIFSPMRTRRHGDITIILDNKNTGKITRVNTLGIVRRTNVPVSCVIKADVKSVVNKLCSVNCAPRRLSDVIGRRG